MVRSNATDRLRLGRVVTGVLWVAGWSLLVAVGPPSGITYIYDENGRLAAVEDPSQGTAVYVYDAAGNVTAISRYAPTKVLVLSFSPPCAPAPASGQGPAVTINGTGFDTTATVTFSASGGGTVSAPASSVTYSQLVTSVPVGAITGAVTVTVGSDSSGKNFTVGCGAPTITDFTTGSCTPPPSCPSFPCQHVGVSGTAVTITGTNFDPTATNDLPAFNNQVAAVTSATATSIGTQVPSIGTSGKIRVDTPFGTALSQADFFAPPAGKTVADMDLCNLGRMGNPTSAGTSATIGTSGKISELLFDGAGGRRVCINITNPSCTPLGCNLGFELLTPAGDQLYYSGCLVQYCPPTTFFDTATLPTTATYAAVLLPSNSSTTGSANLTVYDVPNDPTQFISLTPSGTSVTLANSSPCQNARAYFPEPGGHRVSVKLTASSGNAGLSLIKGEPGGSSLNTIWKYCTDPGCYPPSFIEPVTLPGDGQYLFFFDPGGISMSSVTFTAYDVPADQTQPAIVVNGSSVPVTLNTPGQNALLPITGTTAGLITVHVTSNSFTTNNCVAVSLVDTTTSTTLTSVNSSTTPSSCGTMFNLAQQSVNGTDSYAVSIDPVGSNTGSLNVSVSRP